LRIVVLEDIPDAPELRQAWNELALRMERPEVFYTYEWAVALQRAYRDLRKPWLFLAYDGDLLVGLVALAREEAATGDVVFLAANTADYCDFISDPGRRRELVEGVFTELQTRGINKVVLTNLPADSCSAAAVSNAVRTSRYNLHSRPAYLSARVTLGSGGQRAALKQSIAGKKRLRRNLRELEKKGRVYLRHDKQWEQIEPALESFTKAHIARFLCTGRTSNLIRAERRAFLFELARELSRSGWVVVSRLLAGEVTVAWNYGFQFAGSWFWYQPTVESRHDYADFSPGYCLLAKIVELACEGDEIAVVDLGIGGEEYKDRFATANRETLYYVLNRSFPRHLRTVVRERAAAVAKASPRVESRLRGMISYAAGLRAQVRGKGLMGLYRRIVGQLRSVLFATDKTSFFECTAGDQDRTESSTTLVALDSDLLGAAAIRFADDPAMMEFLMRSAQRFRCEEDRGFALIATDGTPVSFCWVKDLDGFEMDEWNRNLQAPGKEAVMIFDCFPEPIAQGNGLFGEAIAALAVRLRAQGKVPWIFAAAANQTLLRAIEKAGFTYRFSLDRKKTSFSKTRKGSTASHGVENVA
jgi:CelD/BcsL family acetyltransferase involved in cellulose biosynthesis